MNDKITYSVLEDNAEKIRDLLAKDKYRNPDDFLDTAIRILLTWESEHPEECIEVFKRLMPFSRAQEAFMGQTMKEKERLKHFGVSETDQALEEVELQKIKAATPDDHVKLRKNRRNAVDYIKDIEINTPQNIIPYDGYPLLFNFYSRFLPVKIVICVLGDLLQQKNDWKVKLKELRVMAYDIAEELSEKIVAYEKGNDVPRNRKLSTGLPKKGTSDHDQEKIAMAQKRFKDQFIGKVRKRAERGDHFEGALIALGLVSVFKKDEEEYITFTEKGKRLFLLENPVLDGEFEKGSLSKDESDFIFNELIPLLELEKEFVDTAMKTVKDFTKDGKKLTDVLDLAFHANAKDYKARNPELAKKHNLNHIDSLQDSATERKVIGWRVATMGRLAELQKVKWTIDEKGDSEFILK